MKRSIPTIWIDLFIAVGLLWLALEITNNGGEANGSRDAGGGHGLVGMRERVALLDGELTAGPIAGGFRVRATLPVGS